MLRLKLPSGCSKYGAQMGRANVVPVIHPQARIKLQMEKLKWIDWDYDQGGAYWGNIYGTFIYCAWGYAYHAIKEAEPIFIFVRAKSRKHAKRLVREIIPSAKFYV